MTAADKLYQLIQTLPENQINEVLNFAEFLHQNQLTTPQQAIPPGTLTGLRGIATRADAIQKMRGLLKTDQPAPTDQDVADMLSREAQLNIKRRERPSPQPSPKVGEGARVRFPFSQNRRRG
jgi:Protein of unknown function (DUF2281)